MKTNIFNYFKDSWGLSSIFIITIYSILMIASLHDYITTNESIGLIAILVLTTTIGIIVAIDYSKWKSLIKKENKEKIEFKGTTFDPREKK